MKNNLTVFKNEQFGEVRTIEENGKVLFCGSDCAKALGYSKPQNAISSHCRYALKRGIATKQGNMSEMSFIPEGDLYRLITHSKLPSAEKFESWVFDEVLPSIRKTGSYETPKAKAQNERLASVNNAVKILTPMLKAAGCNSKIQLLTAKSLYAKAGVELPLMIEADKQYYDTVHIARQVGIYYRTSGKPADKPVNEIIRRLNISSELYTETWESKGKWQGTVRKYASQVVGMVRQWIADNDYPEDIEYVQSDGQKKCYHVICNREVA